MKRNTDSNKVEQYLKKLDAFFLAVGEADNYTRFVIQILTELKKLIFYEQAVGLFMNAAGKVIDCQLIGVSEDWGHAYREYYSKMQSQFYLGMKKERKNQTTLLAVQPINWSEVPRNEFIEECIESRGVKHSLDFNLFDNRGKHRLILALDRTSTGPYSENDVELINRIIPHLNNMHRKFFLISDPDTKVMHRKDALLAVGTLTVREKEVISCLCEGISPADLSGVLNISRATTYKHIANIYKKLNVNNLQELLVYFLTDYKELPRTF